MEKTKTSFSAKLNFAEIEVFVFSKNLFLKVLFDFFDIRGNCQKQQNCPKIIKFQYFDPFKSLYDLFLKVEENKVPLEF